MAGLPAGEKSLKNMCNRLHTIPACEGRTDRQTDRRTSYHGIVRAMHTRRAVKTALVLLKLTTDRHEASRDLFTTAELLVYQISHVCVRC